MSVCPDTMSLQHIGFAHIPAYRQLAMKSSEDTHGQDLAQDKRDVLIERLNDLVALLSRSDDLEEGTMTEIHSKVDHIEKLVKGKERYPKSSKSPKSPGGLSTIESNAPRSAEEVLWGLPSPTRSMNMRLPNSPALQEQHISPSQAIHIANEAENLAEKYDFCSVS